MMTSAQPIEVNVPSPAKSVYHYTTTAGALGILGSRSLWATHLRYLNDAEEFTHGLRMAKSLLEKERSRQTSAIRRVILDVCGTMMDAFESGHVFVTSFSECDDRLSQWRGYSGAAGVSFGFSTEHLAAVAHRSGWKFKKCIYDDQEKEMILNKFVQDMILLDLPEFTLASDDEEISRITSLQVGKLLTQFYPAAAAFKNAAFHEEREWRFISPVFREAPEDAAFRATPSMMIPYQVIYLEPEKTGADRADIGLVDLKVGPSTNSSLLQRALSLALHQYGVMSPEPTSSSTPYRSL